MKTHPQLSFPPVQLDLPDLKCPGRPPAPVPAGSLLALKIRNDLLSQRNSLMEFLENHSGEEDEVIAQALDPLREFASDLLKNIILALLKLENNTYGTCLGCGEDLLLALLHAHPAELLCDECHDKHELLLATA